MMMMMMMMMYKLLTLEFSAIRRGSGQLGTWKRQPGRPRKCWVKQVTTSTGLSPSNTWSVATDRSAWRALRPVNGQA